MLRVLLLRFRSCALLLFFVPLLGFAMSHKAKSDTSPPPTPEREAATVTYQSGDAYLDLMPTTDPNKERVIRITLRFRYSGPGKIVSPKFLPFSYGNKEYQTLPDVKSDLDTNRISQELKADETIDMSLTFILPQTAAESIAIQWIEPKSSAENTINLNVQKVY